MYDLGAWTPGGKGTTRFSAQIRVADTQYSSVNTRCQARKGMLNKVVADALVKTLTSATTTSTKSAPPRQPPTPTPKGNNNRAARRAADAAVSSASSNEQMNSYGRSQPHAQAQAQRARMPAPVPVQLVPNANANTSANVNAGVNVNVPLKRQVGTSGGGTGGANEGAGKSNGGGFSARTSTDDSFSTAEDNDVLIKFGALLRGGNAKAKTVHTEYLKQKAENPDDANLMTAFICAARNMLGSR